MSSMFDVVLSLFIGGMLMLSMVTAMTTIQAHATNQKIYNTMLTYSLDIGTILKGYYIARMGITHSGNPIISATNNSFRFWAYITDPSSGSPADVDVTITEQTSGGQRNILVYRNGSSSQLLYGPFRISSTGLRIVYYDKNDNVIANPSTHLADIRAVEMGFHTEAEGINLTTSTPRNITNYVYFKKYLINRFK